MKVNWTLAKHAVVSVVSGALVGGLNAAETVDYSGIFGESNASLVSGIVTIVVAFLLQRIREAEKTEKGK